MRSHRAALITLIVVAVAAACGDDLPIDPAGPPAATTAGANDTTRTTTRDTTRRDTTRRDTTKSDTATVTPRPPQRPVPPSDTTNPLPLTAHVSGRVLGATYNREATGSDTLQLAPLAGVTVKLFHNRMVDGASASVFISEVVTGADGSYAFGPIPGGYYLLRAYPPAGSGFSESLNYVPTNRAQISMNIYMWRRPPGTTPPSDSTRRP